MYVRTVKGALASINAAATAYIPAIISNDDCCVWPQRLLGLLRILSVRTDIIESTLVIGVEPLRIMPDPLRDPSPMGIVRCLLAIPKAWISTESR